MRKWILRIIALVVLGGVAVGVIWWRQQRASATASQTAALTQTITVGRGNITASISPTGEVYAVQSASLSFDVVSAKIIELNVQPGQFVRQGDVLARIDTAALQRAVDQAEADLLTAQENLDEALAKASDLDIEGAQLAVTQAEAALQAAIQAKADLYAPDLDAAAKAVREAEYNLEVAKLNLELTKISTAVAKNVRDLEYAVAWHERNVRYIAAGQSGGASAASGGSAPVQGPGRPGKNVEPMTLEEAQAALAEARTQLELAKRNAAITLASAQDRVTQAEEALAEAQKTLAELRAGPTALDVARADNTIAQAEYRLAKAKGDLDTLLAGPDARTVQLAQAKVKAAQATLAEAQKTLQGAVMVAPFDGTVISVNAEVGDEVTSKDVIVTLANLTNLRVRAYIDETKITQVQVGQQARITFDAFPGQSFRGTVLEVPVEGELAGNVVTYEVPMSLEGAERVSLKPGMTANITVEIGSKKNVLRLPAYAVMQTSEGWAVMVQDTTGTTTVTPVQIGLSDGTYVEIVRGLNEGDTVIAQLQQEQQQQFRGGSTFMRMGRVIVR
ncbi:MAG: efflux RND transporter periplasmic adaptor subunit [Anaerolineae bacterium]